MRASPSGLGQPGFALLDGRVFANLWEMRFDAGGRCRDYVEWFMEHPR